MRCRLANRQMSAALLWISVALAASADDRGTSRTEIDRMRRTADATIDRAACAAKGGTVKPQGIGGFEYCVIPYPDAGKTCTAKLDCAGRCLAPNHAAQGASAVGHCQATDAWEGCDATVERGVVSETFCRD